MKRFVYVPAFTALLLAASPAVAQNYTVTDDDTALSKLNADCGGTDLPDSQIDSCLERARVLDETNPSPGLETLTARLEQRASHASPPPRAMEASTPPSAPSAGATGQPRSLAYPEQQYPEPQYREPAPAPPPPEQSRSADTSWPDDEDHQVPTAVRPYNEVNPGPTTWPNNAIDLNDVPPVQDKDDAQASDAGRSRDETDRGDIPPDNKDDMGDAGNNADGPPQALDKSDSVPQPTNLPPPTNGNPGR
jgi:hypothetical protein